MDQSTNKQAAAIKVTRGIRDKTPARCIDAIQRTCSAFRRCKLAGHPTSGHEQSMTGCFTGGRKKKSINSLQSLFLLRAPLFTTICWQFRIILPVAARNLIFFIIL